MRSDVDHWAGGFVGLRIWKRLIAGDAVGILRRRIDRRL
jgi:hypothetical protein